MSYTVTLRGGEVHSLEDADGDDLKAHWMDASKPFPVELGNDTVMSSQIMKITRNRLTAADIPNFDQPKLGEGKKCTGTYSIQREINNIIKSEYPQTWAKEIANKQRREEIRKRLREQPDVMWCDAKVGECAC